MNSLNINDIKSLEEIPDISLYLFTLLIIVLLIILFSIIVLIYKFFKRKNSTKIFYFNELKNIDFSNSKEAAYKITKYGKELISQDREIKLYNELVSQLEEYKYKKEVKSIDKNIKQKYELFMDSLDV